MVIWASQWLWPFLHRKTQLYNQKTYRKKWSFVLLIFFNYFYYISKVEWAEYRRLLSHKFPFAMEFPDWAINLYFLLNLFVVSIYFFFSQR